ncbi:MAG: PDZ domain-containing protein [Trueperaceae bacterium]|nr:PDZ domain-containing protein [Trueperaceae bacterium]
MAIFDEVAQHLRVAYGGAVPAHPSLLLPAARAALDARCARVGDCPQELGLMALEGVLAELGDAHTRLISAEAVARMAREATDDDEPRVIGVVVRAPVDGLGLVVLDAVPGSAAARAGLARGDRIMAVDGVFLTAAAGERLAVLEAAVARGDLRVTVLRAGAPPREVELVAGPVPGQRPPSLSWVAEGVGWLRIPSLVPAEVVATDVHRLVAAAEAAGAHALIVDLRDDLGGTYDAVVAVAGAFHASAGRLFVGPLVGFGLRCDDGLLRVVDPFGRTLVSDALPDDARWTGAVVVLVNAHTQSSAESLALDLQRHAGARVVGEATAGLANTAVQMVPLSNGMRLVLTVATVYDLDGSPLPPRVTPDVFVPDDPLRLAAGHDDPLETAIDLLAPPRP